MLGKVQREAPSTPSCWLVWLALNSDLVAHFIQSAEISLLLRQRGPEGEREEWWGGDGLEKEHFIFSEASAQFPQLF